MRKKAHQHLIFQSTLPARGATCGMPADDDNTVRFQSTLPARGATIFVENQAGIKRFQSTLPARGATATTS